MIGPPYPPLGQAAMAGSMPVALASDQASIPVAATLSAETTKAIGVVRNSDGAGNLLTSNSTTTSSKFGLDGNILSILGTAPSTAGKLDVKGADGDVFVRQATAANLNATVVGNKTNNNAAPGATNVGALVGIANAAVQTWTEGDQVLESMDLSGNVRVTLGSLIAGEDLTNNVMRIEPHYTSSASLSGDTLVKSGAGFIHTVTISPNDSAPTAGSIIIYDNTAESGTQLFNFGGITTTWFAPFTITLDMVFSTGLYVGFTTTADVNVTVSYR